MSNEYDANESKEELSESGTATGIEVDEEEDAILEPFDPDSISIEQKVVPMDTLIRRLKQKTIHLSPGFQRKEVWDRTRRSRLIESLMLKVPLPMFYVAANEEGKWEVVDGLQRLSTIRDFIIGNSDGEFLKLTNLEFLGGKFNGKGFKGIENEPSLQKVVNDIFETEMRFTVINPGTPEAVKRNIFKRINTGGMPLTGQEIRHALYQGEASELLEKLSKSDSFTNAIGSRINDTRMGARELILRFLSFLIMERRSYKSSMDGWLSNAMRVINCMPDLDKSELSEIFLDTDVPEVKVTSVGEIQEKFRLAMNRNKLLFDGHAFRKSLPGDERKSPINKSLFEIWANVLCNLEESEFQALHSSRDDLIENYREILKKQDFASAISRHSSLAHSVTSRYDTINDLVRNTINGGES